MITDEKNNIYKNKLFLYHRKRILTYKKRR